MHPFEIPANLAGWIERDEPPGSSAHAWLADLDFRRSGADRRTPLDRWQEGVARYPIRL